MSDFEFTDFDARMLDVLDRLTSVQEYLRDYGLWFSEQWEQFSDRPRPFFRYAVKDLGNGDCRVSWVLLLDEFDCKRADIEPKKPE